jgi:hypothetical protein
MRKAFLVLFAGCALVLAFALPGQAQDVGKYLGKADFNIRGDYWISGGSNDNMFDFDDETHDARRYLYQRFRWWIDTNIEGKYGGTFGFEHDWIWGSNATQTGAKDNTAVGDVARGDDLNNTKLKHAYIWFLIPGTPVKVTAGLQGFGGLEPNNIMYARDDFFGVRLDAPIIQNVLNVSGWWIKLNEGEGSILTGSTASPVNLFDTFPENKYHGDRDDADLYLINVSGALTKWFRFGQYNQWVHVAEGGEHWLDFASLTTRQLGGRWGARMIAGDYLWHGLWIAIEPTIGSLPVYFRAHGNYFWGRTDEGDDDVPASQKATTVTLIDKNGAKLPVVVSPYGDVVDPRAWAVLAHAGIKPGPFDIGVRFAWFQGADDITLGTTVVDKKPFTTMQTNGARWNGWSSVDAFHGQFELFEGGYKSWQQGWSTYTGAPRGHAYVALDATWQTTKQLSLNLLGGYIWATNWQDKPFAALWKPNGNWNKSKELGWEVDLTATYKIYPNLTLDLIGAYFFAGKGLDHVGLEGAPGAAPAVWSNLPGGADDAWELFWRLRYVF